MSKHSKLRRERNELNLGFHYHQPASLTDGKIFMTYFLGAFVDSIAPHFSSVTLFLHSPCNSEKSTLTYVLKSENVTLVNLGERLPVYHRLFRIKLYQKIFSNHKDRVDVMLFRVTTVLLPFVARYFPARVLYFVSHSSKGIEKLNQPWLRKRLIIKWTQFYSRREAEIARSSICIANGHELKAEWEGILDHHVELIPSTTISTNDIVSRTSCEKTDFRILYVGRLSFLKGLMDIIQAIKILRTEGLDISLDLVGEFEREDKFRIKVLEYIDRQGLQHAVHFCGFLPGGNELRKKYMKSDIFVIASRESEGFPRVIWESMAFSVPVVATDVGSIASFVRDAIVLVTCKEPASIASGIRRLLESAEYRNQLILRGRELVRGNTLEIRGRQLSDYIKQQFAKIDTPK